MIERIRLLLKEKNINAAQFADSIGVQRSSISHVLSGRNKPSLEFIQKILKTYPDISSDWLISGKGDFRQSDTESGVDLFNALDHSTNEKQDIHKMRPQSIKNEEKKHDIKKETPSKEGSSIERVIIFYKNGTMKVYSPD